MSFHNKFFGIRYLNGNKVKSKYTNVVPCGTYVTDRDGQTVSDYSIDPFRDYDNYVDVNGRFFFYGGQYPPFELTKEKTSDMQLKLCFRLGNGRLVKVFTLNNYLLTEINTSFEKPVPEQWNRSASILRDGDSFGDNWSWCESSTKPSQLYISDGKHIFYTNYTNPIGQGGIEIFSLILPTFVPDDDDDQDTVNQYVVTGNGVCFDEGVSMNIGNIFWYDNKLGCVDRDTSNVYLTCSDPAQFYRDAHYGDRAGEYINCGEWYDTVNKINNLWISRYRSSLSTSWLQFVYPSAGQLWFMNNDNIETWVRSGNERAPLNSTSSTPVSFSAIDAKVIDGTLYIYGKNSANQYRLAKATSEGIMDLTNDAISDELDDTFFINSTVLDNKLHIRLAKALKEEVRGYETGVAYAVDPNTGYWCYLDDSDNTNFIRWYCGDRVGFTTGGSSYLIQPNLVWLNNETYEPKNRELVEAFDVFALRKSFAMVRLQVDTDEFEMIEENKADYIGVEGAPSVDREFSDIVLSVSNDKGNTFSTSVRRKIPKLGNGAENITWRNVGSGFSILLKFTYSCLRKILLYGIEIENR